MCRDRTRNRFRRWRDRTISPSRGSAGRWVEDYNIQGHWAHRDRKDFRRSPAPLRSTMRCRRKELRAAHGVRVGRNRRRCSGLWMRRGFRVLLQLGSEQQARVMYPGGRVGASAPRIRTGSGDSLKSLAAAANIFRPRSPSTCGISFTLSGRSGARRSSRSGGVPARVVDPTKVPAFSTASVSSAFCNRAACSGASFRRVFTVPGIGAFAIMSALVNLSPSGRSGPVARESPRVRKRFACSSRGRGCEMASRSSGERR